MARRIAVHSGLTPTATNDSSNLGDSTYPIALQGGSATQRFAIDECCVTGEASSGAVSPMLLAFDSQVGSGALTADASTSAANLTDGVLDGSANALGTTIKVFNKAATNKPQRDTAKFGPNMNINAFGGIAKFNWPENQRMVGVGNTASFGEISLSSRTGGAPGLLGAHIIYEPF